MNSKIIYSSILIGAMLVCLALAAQDDMSSSAGGSSSGNKNAGLSSSSAQAGGSESGSGSMSAAQNGQQPNCPVRGAMGYMQNMLNKVRPQKSQSSSNPSASGSGLNRRKRQADSLNNLPQPELNYSPNNGQQNSPNQTPTSPTDSTSLQDPIELEKQESRLRMLLRRLMDRGVLPSVDQLVQMITVLVTLALMSLLGPAAGANAPLIQGLINKVVPIIVSSLLRYAIHPANSVSRSLPSDQVTMLPLEPVPVAQSRFRQLI